MHHPSPHLHPSLTPQLSYRNLRAEIAQLRQQEQDLRAAAIKNPSTNRQWGQLRFDKWDVKLSSPKVSASIVRA